VVGGKTKRKKREICGEERGQASGIKKRLQRRKITEVATLGKDALVTLGIESGNRRTTKAGAKTEGLSL